MNKKIRSCVYIGVNAEGGVYESTDEGKTVVNIEQKTVWWEGNELHEIIRRVTMDTDCRLHKKGHKLPGNIKVVMQIEPIGEEDEYLLYDEWGRVVHTDEGCPIYMYYYYSPTSLYQCEGELDEDTIEKLNQTI